MNRLLYIIIVSLLFTSCKDEFDMADLQAEAKLQLCCFPETDSDTTWIQLTRSIPMKAGAKYQNESESFFVEGASISCMVNGQPRQVECAAPFSGHYNTRYYFTGRLRAGDHLSITAKAEGYHSVSAETTLPEPCPVTLNSAQATTVFDPLWAESESVYQLRATFTDHAETEDYYAVRVCCGHPDSDYSQILDTARTYFELYPITDPILQPLTEIDNDFGFENSFYDLFYIFSDATIKGKSYTLCLNVNRYASDYWANYYDSAPFFQVILYRISPEMYQYLRSVNDIENNALAEGGFSMLTPTYSNVHGGLGVVGGCAASASNWLPINE